MHAGDRTNDGGAIVVGYDGSPSARAAVRHAFADAALRGLGVRVVTVVHRRDRWAEVCYLVLRIAFPDVVARAVAAARACADETVGADPVLRGVPVGVTVVRGRPGAVLVDESSTAVGLVLGEGGTGGDGPGPVARHCMAHARCPVTVVPAPASRRGRSTLPG
jgi:nucleotide-binding universal stress UspA family protein